MQNSLDLKTFFNLASNCFLFSAIKIESKDHASAMEILFDEFCSTAKSK